MGVFAGGFSARPDIPAIAAEMRPALYGWFTGHILLVDPKTIGRGKLDPISGERAESVPEEVLFDSGPNGALIQPIRAASLTNFGGQAVGIQGVRFQTKLDVSFEARAGLSVRVLDGGEDSTLTGYEYSLSSGVDSTLAWGRIYEARVVVS